MVSQKTPTARWRSTPRRKGLASIGQGPTGIQLREGTKVVIQVAPVLSYPGKQITGWYWYGFGQNTAHAPRETLEEAKADAVAYYKANKSE